MAGDKKSPKKKIKQKIYNSISTKDEFFDDSADLVIAVRSFSEQSEVGLAIVIVSKFTETALEVEGGGVRTFLIFAFAFSGPASST